MASVTFIILPIVLILLGLVIWGLITLFHRKPAAAIAFCLSGVACMLFVGLFLVQVRYEEVARDQAATATHQLAVPKAIATPIPMDRLDSVLQQQATGDNTTPMTTWAPASDLLPEADINLYPSQDQAEHATAAAIHKLGHSRIELIPTDNTPAENLNRLADQIARSGTLCSIATQESPSEHNTPRFTVYLGQADNNQKQGYLAVHQHIGDDATQPFFSARFADKPWVTDLSTYRTQQNSTGLYVGMSRATESTPHDAEQTALWQAASQLAPRIAGERGRSVPAYNDQHPDIDSIVNGLQRLSLVEDQFTQQFTLPYGTVYRHAVLIDASPSNITNLAKNADWTSRSLRAQQIHMTQSAQASAGGGATVETRWAPTVAISRPSFLLTFIARVAGLGVLIAITLLIYRILDRWTLGYRQGALTISAIAVILVGAALLGLAMVN